jgi:RNA polymerase sigma-B factor
VSSGSNFLAFAVPTVMGEVRRYFRDHGWALKVPRRLKELGAELNAASVELMQLLNRAPTASELAAHLGIAREEVVEALIAANAYSTRSTDLSIGSEGDEHTIANSFGELDPNIEKVLDVQAVRPLLDALPDRDRMIITLRFFENMTQTEIADRLGISQMHVSRLLARALCAMREELS